ncbi:TPA: response regulator transcription factor, partial [Klebsiella pneumoniae]|nr:response regulator transcription factor [Klebsiella pneumoniae]MBE8772144.1 response regulator transcription factor [Klebsiella quasipneumoniae]HDU3595153.1 response regulator transcription factor [Klebsiella pneumoniae subsp. pneumoniae]HBR3008546.1 response regulator transcription factor [Klebsiella pneumoniae]HBR4414116.1 response regulator transcription factor [Klebsiella pneumoniae]
MNNINLIRSETTKGIHVIKGKALIDDILSYSILHLSRHIQLCHEFFLKKHSLVFINTPNLWTELPSLEEKIKRREYEVVIILVDSDYIDFYRSLINHPYVIAIPMSESLENIKSMISREINKYTPQRANKKEKLTPREKNILYLTSLGWSNKEIALILDVSNKTIFSHKRKIMDKVNLKRPNQMNKVLSELMPAQHRKNIT